MPPIASIVIPAHNEAAVIGDLLGDLCSSTSAFEIIVVCNGCRDDTADVARRFTGVAVIEIPIGSKPSALNAGDALATVYPRLYLDADVRVPQSSLSAVIDALNADSDAAAPLPRVDTSESGMLIRLYFQVWNRLGYATRGALGSGVYGLSEAGRGRFAQFPEIIADDGFVYCHFEESERCNPPGAFFSITPPQTVSALFRRRVRIVAGNIELTQKLALRVTPPGPDWKVVLRREPHLAAASAAYLAINSVAALAARRRAGLGTAGDWNQDRTSRKARPSGDELSTNKQVGTVGHGANSDSAAGFAADTATAAQDRQLPRP